MLLLTLNFAISRLAHPPAPPLLQTIHLHITTFYEPSHNCRTNSTELANGMRTFNFLVKQLNYARFKYKIGAAFNPHDRILQA